MAQPAYPQSQPLAAVASRLTQATAHPAHAFLADDYSLLNADPQFWQHLLGHRQITDCYLLGWRAPPMPLSSVLTLGCISLLYPAQRQSTGCGWAQTLNKTSTR